VSATIYTIDNGFLTDAGGRIVPVFRFNFSLVHNGIPELKCEIDPVHFGTGALANGIGHDVTKAGFGGGYGRYLSLFNAMEQRSGATASFSFSMTGTDGDKQKLELKDWIITDAGLGSYTFAGGVSVLVTLAHPAVKLNDGNMYIAGSATDTAHITPQAGDNVLKSIVANLKELAKGGMAEGLPEGIRILRSRTSELLTTLESRLEWKAGAPGWPNMGILNRYNADAAYNSVLGLRPVTPWEFVSRELVNRWYLSLRPTYWRDKLELCPYNPWAAATCALRESDIEMISVPSTGDRLSGVVNTSLQPALIGTSAMMFSQGVLDSFRVAQAHVENIAGPVLSAMIPDYLSAAVAAYLKNQDSAMDPVSASFSASTPNATLETFAPQIATAMSAHMSRVCKQVFCNYYRQNAPITLKTRLLLNTSIGVEGKHILPGHACLIQAADGAPAIKFLVTAVDHVVDCNSHEAYTIVNGAYTAPAGAPALVAIPAGVAPGNYVYA